MAMFMIQSKTLVQEFYANVSMNIIEINNPNMGILFFRGNWVPFRPSAMKVALNLL